MDGDKKHYLMDEMKIGLNGRTLIREMWHGFGY